MIRSSDICFVFFICYRKQLIAIARRWGESIQNKKLLNNCLCSYYISFRRKFEIKNYIYGSGVRNKVNLFENAMLNSFNRKVKPAMIHGDRSKTEFTHLQLKDHNKNDCG